MLRLAMLFLGEREICLQAGPKRDFAKFLKHARTQYCIVLAMQMCFRQPAGFKTYSQVCCVITFTSQANSAI